MKTRATVARDYAEASCILNALIKTECGDDPNALDSYEVKVLTATNQRTSKRGKVIAAWPAGHQPTAENIIAVCYDDEEMVAEAKRRGWFN